MKYAFANRHLIYALKTIIGRLYFFTRISGAMAPEWQTKNDFRAKVPRIRILFAKWVALANKIRQYYEDIENCSYFIRHSVAMALLMRTKNEQKNEGVPKVDMFRIPFVKWSPRHLFGEPKKLKNRIVRKSFVICSPGRLSGEQKTTSVRKCPTFVYCSPNGSPWRTKYNSITKI